MWKRCGERRGAWENREKNAKEEEEEEKEKFKEEK